MGIRIETEKDPEVLRQAAKLLDVENQRLTQKVLDLTRRLAKAEGTQQQDLALHLAELERQLANARQRLFGDSSEKRPKTKEKGSREKSHRRGHGPKSQPNLPIIEQVHDLDEADKVCPKCGRDLAEMQGKYEDSEEVDVIERRFVIRKHRRKKYRCRCNGHVETALGPAKLIPGGRYSIGFGVEAAVAKYAEHLPLERQVMMMAREGLVVTSQTLWDQIAAVADAVKPIADGIAAEVRRGGLVHVDETTWRMLSKEKKRWQAWGVVGENGVYYGLMDSRSARAAAEVLGGYQGVLLSDGYKVYEKLARDGPGIVHAGCWAHVRRKYVEEEERHPEACRRVLDLIGELYAVEREVPFERLVGKAAQERLGRRAELRAQRSRRIVAEIRAWANEVAPTALPRSGLGRAVHYMLELWNALTRFLDDPRIPLDNNAAERALRGVVVGRKNHYGSKSRRGAEVAAVLYTVIETCKLVGVEPKAYLRKAVEAAVKGAEPMLLPHVMAVQGVPTAA
ncbi:MAG: IS66 family transposase [Verrucomicrobiota bacterium]